MANGVSAGYMCVMRAVAIVLGLLVMLLGPPVWAAAQAGSHHACDLYRQLDRRCGCAGAEHYFLQYGAKYCERFLGTPGWSAAGLRWRDHTLACLRAGLSRQLARSCDCASVRTLAFESHARCYTQLPLSVCRLPFADVARIYRIVDAADLLDPLGVRQVLGVTLACVWQNRNAGARPELPGR